jgi:hypothetical protein
MISRKKKWVSLMSNTLPQPTRQRLSDLRNQLLNLHQILLKIERSAYEQVRGQVSSGELLQLLIHDEQFAWLRYISKLVVQIDEMLGSTEPVSLDEAQNLIGDARALLTPSEVGNVFERKYYNALQYSPDVVLAHAELTQLLEKK